MLKIQATLLLFTLLASETAWAAVAVLAPASGVTAFATVGLGTSKDISLTLTNSSTTTAALSVQEGSPALAGPFRFKGGTYPGTGGSCTSQIAARGTCTVILTFTPTTTSAVSDTLRITYSGGQVITRTLTGTGNQAVLRLTGTVGFATVGIGTSKEITYTLTNASTLAAATSVQAGSPALAGQFQFKGGSYPGTGGTCGARLEAKATCTLIVVFAPTAAGPLWDNFRVNYHDGVTTQQVALTLTGTGNPALLKLTGAAAFSTVGLGTSKEITYTLTNASTLAAATSVQGGSPAFSGPFQFKGGSYPGTGGTCGARVEARGTCTIVVVFSPTASGAASDTLRVSYSDGASAQAVTLALSGTGNPALLKLTGTVGFSSIGIGASKEITYTLTNASTLAAATSVQGGSPAFSGPFHFKGGSYPGTDGTCGARVEARGTCTIVVVFSPTASGAASDTLRVSYHDGATTQEVSRTLTGTGLPAVLTVSIANPVAFGSVGLGASKELTLTLRNTAVTDATSLSEGSPALSGSFLFKGGAFPGGGTCSSTLAAKAACTIILTFSPTSVGALSDTLVLSYHDGATTQTISRSLSGTGNTPAVLALGALYTFAVTEVGGALDYTSTVSNTGPSAATNLAGNFTGPFAFKGGSYPGTGGTCDVTLPAKGNCKVVLTFSPTQPTTSSGTMTLTYFDGVQNQSAVKSLAGIGKAVVGGVSLSGGEPAAFDDTAQGGSSNLTLTMRNYGAATITLAAGSPAPATPFAYFGGAYPGTGGTCRATLNRSATCTLVLSFSPAARQAYSGTLRLNYNDGSGAQTLTRSLAGNGVAPAQITLSGGGAVGSVKTSGYLNLTITLTNNGGVPATSLGFPAPGSGFGYAGSSCGGGLAPNASCTVYYSFSPRVGGAYSTNAVATYYSGAAWLSSSIGLSGTGIPSALIEQTYVQHPTVVLPNTQDQTVTLTNTRDRAATELGSTNFINAAFNYKGGVFPGTGGTCTETLAAGASCNLIIRFAPTYTMNSWYNWSIGYHDGSNRTTLDYWLYGAAVTAAQLTLTDAGSFGTVEISTVPVATFILANTGGNNATSISHPTLSAPFSYVGGSYPGTGGNCATALAYGWSCSIKVQYNPTDNVASSATFNFTYQTGSSSQSVSRNLTGTAIRTGILGISESGTYNFGSRPLNSTSDKTFIVTNSGAAAATSLSASVPSTAFSYKGGSYPGTGGTCTTSLAAGASCSIVVTFVPVGTVSYSNTLSLSYHNGHQAKSATRPMQGTGYSDLTLAVSGVNDFAISPDGSATGVSFWNGGAYAKFTNAAGTVISSVTVSTVSTAEIFVARSRVSGHSAILLKSSGRLKIRMYNSAGVATSALVDLGLVDGSYPATLGGGYDIAIDDNGRAAVVWMYQGYTSAVDASLALVSPDGTVLSRPAYNSASMATCKRGPHVALNKATGAGVVTCQGQNYDGGSSDLRDYFSYRRFDAAGDWVETLKTPTAPVGPLVNVYSMQNPSSGLVLGDNHFVGMNDNGAFVIVALSLGEWRGHFFNSAGTYGSTVSLGGSSLTNGSNVFRLHPRIPILGSDFVIPWQTDYGGFDRFKRFTSTGSTVAGYSGSGGPGRQSIQIDANGNYYFLYYNSIQINSVTLVKKGIQKNIQWAVEVFSGNRTLLLLLLVAIAAAVNRIRHPLGVPGNEPADRKKAA